MPQGGGRWDNRLAAFKHILPAGLAGPGRRPAWQRTRLRRVISACLVATAIWLAMSAYLPEPAPRGVPTAVVTQDLTAGHVLTPGDLTVGHWPSDLRPGGTVADPEALVGKALGAGMSRGEAVTAARIRGPGLLAGLPSGLVVAHIRVADPAMATMATPGDHVDLISSAGRVVAADVAVLAVDAAPGASSSWSTMPGSGSPGGVLVAVSRQAAMTLAAVDPAGLSDLTFSLVMRTPST